jgi:hypothetical protein
VRRKNIITRNRSAEQVQRYPLRPGTFASIHRRLAHRWRQGLVEERHWEVAEIEKLRFNPLSLMKLLKNPLRRFFRKPALTCAADDH